MAKLHELYQRGLEDSITDEDGNTSKFWMKKLNPVESKSCIVKSNAVRARFLTAQRDKESEEYLNLLSEVIDMDEETLLDTVVSKEVGEKAPALEEEIKSDKRWTENNYLESIKDEWEDSAKMVWIDSRPREDGSIPEHDHSKEEVASAERIFNDLTELTEAFDEALDTYRKNAIKNVERLSQEELETKAVDVLFDRAANAAWVETFYKWQVFYSTSDLKTKKRYFDTFDEIEALPLDTYVGLLAAYRKLEVTNTDAKK